MLRFAKFGVWEKENEAGSVMNSTGRENDSNKGLFTLDARELVPSYRHKVVCVSTRFVTVDIFVSFSSVRREPRKLCGIFWD